MFDTVQQWLASLRMSALSRFLPALLILILGIVAVRVAVKILSRALEKSSLEKAAHSLILSLVKVILYTLLCLIIADTLHIKVGSIVALASVLTLSVSLSLQNMLSNVMGGFTLLYTHPFKSGDFVEIAGKSGTIQEISMSYTKLVTPDNKVISIPNSAVTAADIVNYTVSGTRRLDLIIGVDYSAPAQQVIDALLQAATVDNVMLDPPPFAAIDSYGDSAINYLLRIWTTAESYWDVNYQINRNVKTIFEAQHIEIPYPHLDIHMK